MTNPRGFWKTCATCAHFNKLDNDDNATNGQCRARPPTAGPGAIWPIVEVGQWCGEWADAADQEG